MEHDDDPPLVAYLAEWLERRRSQLRPTTRRCYRQAVNSYIVPHLGDMRLSQLDRVLLEEVYNDLLVAGGLHGKPLSVRTVKLAHKVLHRALRDAVVDGLLKANPADLARTPKRDPDEVRRNMHVLMVAVNEVGYVDMRRCVTGQVA